MLNEWVSRFRRRYLTLEDGRYGHLLGTGDPSSIRIDGQLGRPGFLAFHGFAGTPREVRRLTDVAVGRGLHARAPRLAGHDDDVRHLMDARWEDWVSGATAALFELNKATAKPVIVAGLSMGALLAAHLAAVHGERVLALVVLASATRLRFPSPGLELGVCELLRPFGNAFYVPKAGADLRDAEARQHHMTYDANPVRSAIEVLRAGRLVRPELGRVTCPVLVVHGARDRVCPVHNAQALAAAVGTRDVEVAIMPNSGHIVTDDIDRDEVARRVDRFLRRVLGEGERERERTS